LSQVHTFSRVGIMLHQAFVLKFVPHYHFSSMIYLICPYYQWLCYALIQLVSGVSTWMVCVHVAAASMYRCTGSDQAVLFD
jgi:hypothetical protein